jgi:hypothetical protein
VLKNEKQSEKAQLNNERLLNNGKISAKKTRPEITASPNELIDIELFDRWVDNQDVPTQESFHAFAKDCYSLIESYLYARFTGYTGSITACEAWLNSHYPKPDHRKVLLCEITEMQEDLRKLREDIENYAVKRDAGVARIAAMQKELRSTIGQVESYTSNKDRKGLLMAGADQAIRELLTIFKDDPIEGPLHEASMSIWAKMQLSE